MIQEGVNNAVKYANAKHIDVIISEEANRYQIEIKDDGNGFDMATVEQGNGLNNMKKRSRDIDAAFEINSELNKGTSIVMSLTK